MFGFCLICLLARGSASGQEAAVRADVEETLSALNEGNAPAFANFFREGTRGFFVDGSAMTPGVTVLAFRAAYLTGMRSNLTMSNLNVRVYANTAVSGALLTGSVTLPGGAVRTGTWRYSDTRVLEEGTWKIVQYHISQLAG